MHIQLPLARWYCVLRKLSRIKDTTIKSIFQLARERVPNSHRLLGCAGEGCFSLVPLGSRELFVIAGRLVYTVLIFAITFSMVVLFGIHFLSCLVIGDYPGAVGQQEENDTNGPAKVNGKGPVGDAANEG